MNKPTALTIASLSQPTDWNKLADNYPIITELTTIILFLNDQVYNYSILTNEVMINSYLYKHKTKMLFNKLTAEVKRYTGSVFGVTKQHSEDFADITQSMEDDIKPCIEKYYFTISQLLLDKGVTGELNRICSYIMVINMLTRASRFFINEMGNVAKKLGSAHNPVEYLNMDKINKLTDDLLDEILPKNMVIDEHDNGNIKLAIDVFMKKLLNRDVLGKALNINNNKTKLEKYMAKQVKIGLSKGVVNNSLGKEVYYYSYADRFENDEPVKTKITSEVYNTSGNETCFIEGITGIVSISHLSFEYYPKRTLSKRKREAKECYADFLSSETSLSFVEWVKHYKQWKKEYR